MLTCIQYHCPTCGYQHLTEVPRNSFPCFCPKCGDDRIVQGPPYRPVNKAFRDATPRRYDVCSDTLTVQVYLQAATGERCGHTMPEEWVPDCTMDPEDVAAAVLDICTNRYFYCGSKPHVERVYKAMLACKEMSDRYQAINRVRELQVQLVKLNYEYQHALDTLSTELPF